MMVHDAQNLVLRIAWISITNIYVYADIIYIYYFTLCRPVMEIWSTTLQSSTHPVLT